MIGFLVLTFLLLTVTFLPFLFGFFVNREPAVSEDDARLLDSLVSLIERKDAFQYFEFNPNTLSADSMYLTGLRPSVIKSWNNYREKGGFFYSKEDFKKLYGLKEDEYDSLYRFIKLPQQGQAVSTGKKHGTEPRKHVPAAVDINKATPEDLIFINGIGEKISERIVKFRDLLGGFVNEKQLDEIYHLEGSALENLKEHVFIEPGFTPQKINLNISSYKGIIKHPYIDKELADEIFKIRYSADSIITRQKLKDLMSHKDSSFLVLLPYVDF